MNSIPQTFSSKNGVGKTPLFQQWLSTNSEIKPFIRSREWFLFLQFLIKSLKVYDEKSVETYLEKNFPKFFKKGVPVTQAARGITHLRFLLMQQLLEETGDPSQLREKDERIIRLISIFDRMFKRFNERFSASGNNFSQTENNAPVATENRQQSKKLLAFRVNGDRFEGAHRLDRQLSAWLGLDSAKRVREMRWFHFIHPKDLARAQFKLKSLILNHVPIYELSYRLRDRGGKWQSVVELGRIIYGKNNQPAVFNGVILITESLTGDEKPTASSAEILRHLLDARKDVAFVVNKNSQLVHATRAMLNFLLPDNQQITTDRADSANHEFFELLDAENKLVALNFWESLAYGNQPDNPKTLLLRLQNAHNGEQKIVEFFLYHLEKAFGEPHYLLWGKMMPGRRHIDETTERLAVLHSLGSDLMKTTDVAQVYQKVVKALQQVLPNAQSASVLLNTDDGFMFGVGFGYHTEKIAKNILLSRSLAEKHLAGKTPLSEPVELIRQPEVLEELFQNVSLFSRQMNAERHVHHAAHSRLAAVIRVNRKPHLILEAGVYDSKRAFDEMDRYFFRLLLQQASIALERLKRPAGNVDLPGKIHSVLENSPLATLIIQDGECKLYNPKFLALTGQTPGDNVDEDVWSFFHTQDLQLVTAKIAETLKSGSVHQQEFRMLRRDDTEAYCAGVFIPFEMAGRPSVICQITDMTQLHELEKQLRQSQKMDTIGSLAAGISHDFNNILGAIIPSAQMIINHPEKTFDNKKHANIIFHMAKRGALLVSKLLSFSQTEPESRDKIDLNALINEAHVILDKIVGPGVKVNYYLAEKLPEITADYNQMMQMIFNLVANSIEAMPAGGEIHIATEYKHIKAGSGMYRSIQPGEYVRLTVQDTGIGIPEDLRKRIFKPFITSKSDGSGLGLSIVNGILKKHEGYVMLQSEENKGTTFKIYLPVKIKRDEQIAKKPVLSKPKPPARVKKSKSTVAPKGTILVVDDEKYLREVYIGMLELQGFNVIEAASGREALGIYKNRREDISLVILDYGMPELNGGQTYKVLKRLKPDVRVVLSTGYGEQREVARLIRDEHLHFLPKPFTMESLSEKVKSALINAKMN